MGTPPFLERRAIDVRATNLFLVASLLALSLPAAAQQGTVSFLGELSSMTCVVDPLATGPSDGTNFIVRLPRVAQSSLRQAGQRGVAIPFHVFVGSSDQPCLQPRVRAMFRSVGDNNPAGRLTNRGTAGNVDVVVSNELHQDIDLNSNANSLVVDIDPTGIGVLSWNASYYATASARPGTVTARVQYVLEYP